MIRGKKSEITPRYDWMFDCYVTNVKLAYNEYKNAMIKYLNNTWIGGDGSFNVLGMDYHNKKLAEKRLAYEESIERMNAFKTLYGDKIEEIKQFKELT